MTLVRQFLNDAFALEVFWLVGLVEDAQRGWLVKTVTRNLDTRKLKTWPLPIGMLPLLAPGRVFIQGLQSTTTRYGHVMPLQIADVAAAEELTTDEIPPELWSFGKRRTGVQRVLRYKLADGVVLVPTIEMVRYLFLHNKTVANALMRPGGIMELFCPEEPGFHPSLHLRFTRRMPRNCLSDAFVAEFSWMAVDPEGRQSWDSVRDQTAGRPYVSFAPPRLLDSRWAVRAREWRGMILVLEILSMTGKRFPCDLLRYSHPSIRETKAFRPTNAKPRHQNSDIADGPPDPALSNEPVIDVTASGSRGNIRQTALHTPGKMATFDKAVPIEKVVLEVRPTEPSDHEKLRHERPRPPHDHQHLERKQTSVSVAEEDSSNSLPPIEFRLLEPADPDDIGELEPMMTVVKLMASALPTVHVASSLCLLKPGRAFSLVGRRRRPCLVAVFTPSSGIPLVLVSVDHSGQRSLSSLALAYRQPCQLHEIEAHIAALLEGLVHNGGHWQWDIASPWKAVFSVKRFPRVLRCRSRLKDEVYLEAWAHKLNMRLHLIRNQT